MIIKKVGVIGLGYVGLPLAVAASKKYLTIGFDIKKNRINELKKGEDNTKEIKKKNFFNKKNLTFTYKLQDLKSCNFYIITVPTPINKKKKPDLKLIKSATEMIAKIIKKGDVVVYESTVYPGLTREYCVPIIEEKSQLILNKDFWVGYSPERINPGDKVKTIYNIIKVTSGSDRFSEKIIDNFYKSIITAGTFLAKNIETAEAAKIIENTQRDINIALMNEFSTILNKMKLRSEDVLNAASTKWNFLNFNPGLVGGHCIGVDPYYLAEKAISLKCNPKIILAGRSINDQIPKYLFEIIKKKIKKKKIKKKINCIIFGATFKDNCSDTRNSKILDLYNLIKINGMGVSFFDPLVSKNSHVKKKYNFVKFPKKKNYNILIYANNHKCFQKYLNRINHFLNNEERIVIDLKNKITSCYVDFVF
jgi:UDP-N-acetyl-D-galactosamine dehydrogenase